MPGRGDERLVAPDKATLRCPYRAQHARHRGPGLLLPTASEALKGIDTARITVLNVSGVANAPSEIGTTIQDHFDCRAYFVDGALAHTLVVFDHGH